MDTSTGPIQIQLTKEQQAVIQRLSGQQAQILELVPDRGDGTAGAGRGLQFRWRLSVATGIPRQQWDAGDATLPADPSEGSTD